jgi:hypothetical protein
MSMATSEQCRYLGRRLETQEFQETALRNEATREQAVKKSLRLVDAGSLKGSSYLSPICSLS